MRPTPAPATVQPRYLRLRDHLIGEIRRGRWRPSEAIPTEAELAKEHQVSVGTVRKAVDDLVSEGLVERVQGKGTFVRRPKFDASLFRFFRFHAEAGERRIPESRILSLRVETPPALVADALRLPRRGEGIHLSRLRSLDGRPLLLESIWLSRAKFAALLAIDPREFGDLLYPLYEQYCGQVIASAQETLTAEAAAEPAARLLEVEEGSPLIAIERLALRFDGHPIEWRVSRGAASQFRYQVEIR